MMCLRPALLATLSLLALSACGGSKPAADLYVLHAPEMDGHSRCLPHGSLVVTRPLTRAEYDTKRIAILLGKSHLTYYTGAVWASPLPDQLQGFMVDTLGSSGRFTTVEDDSNDSGAATSLSITILEANVANLEAPVAHLRLTAILRDAASHRILSKTRINEAVPADENHMANIVDAFNTAARDAAAKIMAAMKPRCSMMAGD